MNIDHSDGRATSLTGRALADQAPAIRDETRGVILTRLSSIESAAANARYGSLANETRRVAEYDAQKLGGLLASLGFASATQLVFEAERLLQGNALLSRAGGAQLLEIVAELKNRLTIERAA